MDAKHADDRRYGPNPAVRAVMGVLLSVFYWTFLVPFATLLRAAGRDRLGRRFARSAASYRVPFRIDGTR